VENVNSKEFRLEWSVGSPESQATESCPIEIDREDAIHGDGTISQAVTLNAKPLGISCEVPLRFSVIYKGNNAAVISRELNVHVDAAQVR
jgi:hypothetical protein